MTCSGIDAVGGFDMQSGNYGDWNAYSKYAVGWLQPEVVQGLASGESVELTIGALAAEGDAIVIPAAGKTFDGPFGEYILIDLFTDSGANEFDVAMCDLSGVTGVRISHVDARREKRELTDTENPMNTEVYPIGTIHYPNMYNEKGLYNIEVIQAGGTNTFTKRPEEGAEPNRTTLRPEDLFQAGDVFTAESYSEFLTDGRMDDGSEFGYSVEIVSIGTDAGGHTTATIRITAK